MELVLTDDERETLARWARRPNSSQQLAPRSYCARVHLGGDQYRGGYHGDRQGTDASLRDGFFTVGDVGYLDDDGYLYIVDRVKDMIIAGGVNIYPAEVEEVLREHPAVLDVAVIGVPDDDLGEHVHAVGREI